MRRRPFPGAGAGMRLVFPPRALADFLTGDDGPDESIGGIGTAPGGRRAPFRCSRMSETMKKRLRVLYVDYSVGFGGAVKSLSLMLRCLPDVEAMIITAQDRNLVNTWLAGYRVWPFRRVVNYRTLWRVRSWIDRRRPALLRSLLLKTVAVVDLLATVAGAVRIAWILKRQRIDVLHLNNSFIPQEAFWASRLVGVPCVVHLRGFASDGGESVLRNARFASHVIAVSGAVAADLEGTPVYPDRVTVVHDPVDLDRAVSGDVARQRIRLRHGLEPHHVAAGIFGRVIEWKGQIVFVEAAIRAMRQNPDLRAVIVGDESDGGREYVERIHALIRGSGFKDRFVLAGYTPDVEAYYAAMDVVVHASITPEPFGMVVPEAMAAGRAVIAADAGGPREVVTHGHDGLLVPPGDVDALAAALLRLAADPAERRRLAENAYRTAHARFGIEANASAVRRVYDVVLSDRPRLSGARPAPHVAVGAP